MRLTSFTVCGFRNFVRPVSLQSLEEITVLYGPNGSGKSNLLRALELYFRLLGLGETVTRAQFQAIEEPTPELEALLQSAFHRLDPQPIVFTGEWALTNVDLELAGLLPDFPCGRVTTQLELRRNNRLHELHVTRWLVNTEDAANLDRTRNAAFIQFCQQLRRMLSDACPFQFDHPVLPFRLLGDHPEIFPQSLRDELFDARQSTSPDQRKRWSVFHRLASTLELELGSGTWDTAFDRSSGHANLVYTRGEDTVPLDSMGAGVQRVAALLAELALARERWIAIEEPEWKLHPELQKRFAVLARRALEANIGPTQLLITSHSPVIANAGSPYAVSVEDEVVRVDRMPWSTARPGDAGDDGGTVMIGEEAVSLSSLINLVDTLSEIEPEELVGGGGSATAPADGPEPAGREEREPAAV